MERKLPPRDVATADFWLLFWFFVTCALFLKFRLIAYYFIGPFSCCYPSPHPTDTGDLLFTFLVNVPLLAVPVYLLLLLVQRFMRLRFARPDVLWLPYRFHLVSLCMATFTSGALSYWVLLSFQDNVREGAIALLLSLAATLLVSGYFEYLLFPPNLAPIPLPPKHGRPIQKPRTRQPYHTRRK